MFLLRDEVVLSNNKEKILMHEDRGPGLLLKKARESRGLSVRDLSLQLRLSEKIIHAIELNDYAELPGPAYMRGYLRAYARTLRISEVEILKQYDLLGHTDVMTRPTVKLSLSEYKEKQRSRLAYWIAFAIGVLLIILVAIWWHNQQSGSQASPQTYLPQEAPAVAVPAPVPEAAQLPTESKAKLKPKEKPTTTNKSSLEVVEPGL